MTLWDLLDKHPNWTPIFLFFALLCCALLSSPKEPPK